MQAPSKDEIKDQVIRFIDGQKALMISTSLQIHGYAEMGYQEYKSSSLLISKLKEEGFETRSPIAGLDTAFKALKKFASGRGRPLIAFDAEYDALPVVDFGSSATIGHACGHNLNATAAIFGAIAVSRFINSLEGSVAVVGTPAEEGGAPGSPIKGGGKLVMLREGVWNDIDCTLIMHAHSKWTISQTCTAVRMVRVSFRGRRRELGKPRYDFANPIDTLGLFMQSLTILDQHVSRETAIQRIVAKAGETPNVVPIEVEVKIWARAGTDAYLDSVMEKITACAKGAALATGAESIVEEDAPPYKSIVMNKTLQRLAEHNMERIGIKYFPDEMLANNFATDFGNVSQTVPSLLVLAGLPTQLSFHTLKGIEASKSEDAMEAMILACKVMALTAVDLLYDPSLIDEAKRELANYRNENFQNVANWHME